MNVEDLQTLKEKRPVVIGVHDGIMHADEVFGVAAMHLLLDGKISIMRSRNPEELKQCDIRIDVGDMYCHETGDYDHHMAWFDVRHNPPPGRRLPNGECVEFEYGPMRSGFGLIWLHYGYHIVQRIVDSAFQPNQPATIDSNIMFKVNDYIDIQKKIDNGLVSYIDAVDNGEKETFYISTSPFRDGDICTLISIYNPPSKLLETMSAESIKAEYTSRFFRAVDFAVQFLKNLILRSADTTLGVKIFTEMLVNRKVAFDDAIDKESYNWKIVKMTSYLPWALAYTKAIGLTDGVEMVIYPTTTGTWICQSPRYYKKRDPDFSEVYRDGTKRVLKHRAPENICGKRDEELVKLTGVKDAVFVHRSGHLGVAKTADGAFELAKYIIDHGD